MIKIIKIELKCKKGLTIPVPVRKTKTIYSYQNTMQSEMADFAPDAAAWRTGRHSVRSIRVYSFQYMKTWSLPQNRKYITIAVREGPSQGHGWHYIKIGELWTCGFWDMWADSQTDKQTDIQTQYKTQLNSIQTTTQTQMQHLSVRM